MNQHSHVNVPRKARIVPGLLAFCVMFAACPAFAQYNGDDSNRINRLENEVETLSRAIYKGETPPPGSLSSGGSDMADTVVKIQQMEGEIRVLTGKLEEQDFQIRQLKDQLEKALADMNIRLGDLEGSGAQPRQPARYTASPIRSGSYDQEGGMEYQRAGEGAPAAAAGDSSAYTWSSGNGAPADNSNIAPSTSGQLGTLTQAQGGEAPPVAGDGAAALYDSAFSELKSAQYDNAERDFNDFLVKYPDHALAANAKYWLGESYYARGKFADASKVFAEGYQKYPKAAKAPDNLLKLGLSLSGMGKKNDACIALRQVEKDYASGAEPVLHRAKQEMTRLGC